MFVRRVVPIVGVGLMAGLIAAGRGDDPAAKYQSPYSVKFTYPEAELIGDVLNGRAAPAAASEVPPQLWYSPAVRAKYGSWGPPRRHLPAPEGAAAKPAGWKRERVIAVGLRYAGLHYQHHHLPDWDPPAGWPWKEVGCGHNGKGVDCSNFTAHVYNVALGLNPSGDVHKQAEETEVAGPGGPVKVTRVELPKEYDEFSKVLKTGDLLYIRNDAGKLGHVVIWVGDVGRSPDGVPLILDSTGGRHKDSTGALIPDGIHLRPFEAKSWYARSANHAHRLIAGE